FEKWFTCDGESAQVWGKVDYSFDCHGLPVALSLTQMLTADGEDSTRVEVSGSVQIKVPLLGAKLEKQAAEYIRPVFENDAKLIEKVLGV
ncbi:MAG: DUF2505 domain-containing protein, partial [Actinomycetaceae bacterium]|nr:DUF2505 domain-containing protein [Actinomycetaceae bacterium]